MDRYGIRSQTLQWIRSNFLCRKQFVQFKQSFSSYQTIKRGVPQCSILGPLFFIVYINDISIASNLTESLMFADVTSLYYSYSDPNYLQSVMNDELQNFELCFKSIKLSVNVKKLST